MYPSSSAISNPPEDGLLLKYGLCDVILNWTVEPDAAVADATALHHSQLPLPSRVTTRITRSYSFPLSGALNKLFLSPPVDNVTIMALESFMMRVSLPIDPYFRTASEVAVIRGSNGS